MHLLEALARQFQITVRRLLRFLDEGMQHDNPHADKKAVERPAYAITPARPQLEQAIAEGARVRQAKTRAMFHEQFDKAGVVGEHIHRP